MKRLLYLPLIAIMAVASFVSCDDDEKTGNPPEFAGAEISGNNAEITLTFNEGVYSDENGEEALNAESFKISLTGGAAQPGTFTVEHNAGGEIATILFNYTGVATGEEVVRIQAASIYNANGLAMKDDQEITVELQEIGIIGEWYSSGDNVAGVLVRYFDVDSVYAQFNDDQTYTVESYNSEGVKTEYTGTYTQTKTDVNDIYTIVLNQSTPSVLTSEGIFALFPEESDYHMKYEVVQTEPSTGNTPPTPEGGFGSSSDGNLGTLNIQKFKALD